MKKEIWIGITGLGVGLLVGATLENKLFSTRKQDEKIIKNLKEDNEELTEINETLREKIKIIPIHKINNNHFNTFFIIPPN